MRLIRGNLDNRLLSCSLLVALVAISASMWHQTRMPLIVDQAEVTVSLAGERIFQDLPLTGASASYHPNGQMATFDEFVEGRREGYSRKWFENGILGYEANYLAELKQGVVRSWWSNGNPRSEEYFAEGLLEGEGWHWYNDGAEFKKTNHLAGQPVGVQQAWRKNGELFSNYEYRNGRIFGLNKANSCLGLEDEQISLEYYDEQAG